jgi:hypothetical protein
MMSPCHHHSDDKTSNISRPSPACSIIDKKARSLHISFLTRAAGRVRPMITLIAFIAYRGSNMERAPAFRLDCLDHPPSPR